jgi:hypothetical protein
MIELSPERTDYDDIKHDDDGISPVGRVFSGYTLSAHVTGATGQIAQETGVHLWSE